MGIVVQFRPRKPPPRVESYLPVACADCGSFAWHIYENSAALCVVCAEEPWPTDPWTA